MNFLKGIMAFRDAIPHKSNPLIELGLNFVEDYLGLSLTDPNIVGAFGDVVFEVSSKRVETLRDFKRSAKGRYATHEIVGGKSVAEYLGVDADEITFKMQLSTDLGVKIPTEIAKLLALLRSGEPNYLILGGQALGVYMWYLTALDIHYDYTNHQGAPIFSTIDVTMKECVR